MEIPSRPKNDRYTRPGQYTEIERRLRANPANARIPVVVAYAFDYRTRLGPFLFADTRLLTAGPRAIAGALHSAGFTRTRIVLRQWNRNFRPSEARLDGDVPQMLFVSSMQIHSASAYEMIEDAYRLGEERPLILAGGAKAIYEPWDFFGVGRDGRYDADVAVTGEEYVALELLDRIMEARAGEENPRKTFHRLRRSGLLDDIPGLVFREGDERRRLGPSDQHRHPAHGAGPRRAASSHYGPGPHRAAAPPTHAIAQGGADRSTSPLCGHDQPGDDPWLQVSLPLLPHPGLQPIHVPVQELRALRDEMAVLAEQTGIHAFFGTDDNFFNNRETVDDVFTGLAKGKVHGKPFRDSIFFGTEATEFDVFKNQDLLPLCRDGGFAPSGLALRT